MLNIAIFASGSGSNAENIMKYFEDSDVAQVKVIVSNKKDAYVHERAKKCGIESVFFQKSEIEDSSSLLSFLERKKIDLIVLAGFLLKIPKAFVDAYPSRILNIHPALLPKYGGKGMYGDNVHKAVVLAQEQESGITIHLVDENYDQGNIVFQASCKVLPSDDYGDVAEKVHLLEYEHFPKIIEQYILCKL